MKGISIILLMIAIVVALFSDKINILVNNNKGKYILILIMAVFIGYTVLTLYKIYKMY